MTYTLFKIYSVGGCQHHTRFKNVKYGNDMLFLMA